MIRTLFLALLLAAAPVPVTELRPAAETEPMPNDVDDPAIWINRHNPAASLIVGTIKRPKPAGGLAVYNLQGKLLELVPDIDRPNNVDILDDLCLTTERLAHRLRAFRVSAAKPHLTPIGEVPVFEGQSGPASDPMGIALYKRKRDGALFAIVSRKTGPATGYLWQYRLTLTAGRLTGQKVRELGNYSNTGEIEAVAVDQENGLVYYSDENCCVRVWQADPDSPTANREQARFAETGFRMNREGIAITADRIIVTDQLPGRSEYHMYRRGDRAELAIWRGTADMTDGIEATSQPLGPLFPKGVLITMNNARHNFHLYPLP